MDLQLEDRVAVVTGGSMGLGLAIAQGLAAEGVKVVIAARRPDKLEQAAAEINERTGHVVTPLVCDTSSTESVTALAAEVEKAFGRTDILVNGAATPSGLVRDQIDQADPDLLLEDLNTKVVGYFRCARALVPLMRRNRFGRIVNIGGLTGRASHALSGMRNLAVVHLTKALSDQLGPDGVTVNTIHPGVVDTEHIRELYATEAGLKGTTPQAIEQGFIDRTPIRRVLTADEIADLVVFLASPRAAAITGESIGIDGGLTRGIFI